MAAKPRRAQDIGTKGSMFDAVAGSSPVSTRPEDLMPSAEVEKAQRARRLTVDLTRAQYGELHSATFEWGEVLERSVSKVEVLRASIDLLSDPTVRAAVETKLADTGRMEALTPPTTQRRASIVDNRQARVGNELPDL